MSDNLPKKIGYCTECGDALWQGIDHKCAPMGKYTLENVGQTVSQMLDALVLADLEFSGKENKEDPGRARAAVRRVIRKLGLKESDFLFRSTRTSADLPDTDWS